MTHTTLKNYLNLPDFDSLGAGSQAAERWIAAMAAIGGQPLDYPHCLDVDHWTASTIAKAMRKWRTHGSDEKTDAAFELMEGWLAEAMGDPAGEARVLSKMSWCFQMDADNAQSSGDWSPSDGAMIFIWPTDAQDHDIEGMTMPHDMLGYNQPMEAVWALAEDEITGKLSMQKAWADMEGMGCRFDIIRQKSGDFFHGGRGFYEDSDQRLHQRISELIPAFAAEKEKSIFEKSIKSPKSSKAKPRI